MLKKLHRLTLNRETRRRLDEPARRDLDHAVLALEGDETLAALAARLDERPAAERFDDPAVARLLPGVLGNPASAQQDSFSDGLLEGPSYTRPVSPSAAETVTSWPSVTAVRTFSMSAGLVTSTRTPGISAP